jgi:hypothetical protein
MHYVYFKSSNEVESVVWANVWFSYAGSLVLVLNLETFVQRRDSVKVARNLATWRGMYSYDSLATEFLSNKLLCVHHSHLDSQSICIAVAVV